MNNQERAELAFEYFMEYGEVSIGNMAGEYETLTRMDVIQEFDGEDLMIAMSKNKILWTELTDSVNAFQQTYSSKAFEMILKLIDKHYED